MVKYMSVGRALLVVTLVSLPVVPARADPSRDVSIKVSVRKALRVSRKGLRGKVVVLFANKGAKAVALYHEEANSLHFVPVKGGPAHVVFHSCACLRNARGGAFSVGVPPGGKKKLVFDDWGCDGSWTPPPPGVYTLRYHVFTSPHPHKVGAGQMWQKLKRCRADLTSPAYLKGAITSPPLKVRVRGHVKGRKKHKGRRKGSGK